MTLIHYIAILSRRKWVIAATLLITLGVVLAGMSRMQPTYSSSATVRLTETRTGSVSYSDQNYAERLRNTYVQILESGPVLQAVIDQLGLSYSVETLEGMVKAEAIPSTELIRIGASGRSPEEAAGIASALAEQATSLTQAPFVIQVVGPATPPSSPSQPRPELYLPLAALIGLLGGMGLALLFENMDRSIHSVNALGAATTAPLLGWIPNLASIRNRRGSALVASKDASVGSEAFRVLGANLLAKLATGRDGSSRGSILLITSPEPRTGKSTVLANLAAFAAREGRRVIVVGSDLRNPGIETAFGLTTRPSGQAGIRPTTTLEGRLVRTNTQGVMALVISPYTSTPIRHQLEGAIDELAKSADLVLLDSPAVLASADAVTIAPLVDEIILVAARDVTTDRNLEIARAQLEAAGGRIAGVVFNRSEIPTDGNYYGYRANKQPVVSRTQAGDDTRTEVAGTSEPLKTQPAEAVSSERGLEKAG